MCSFKLLVRVTGLEPAQGTLLDPKSSASANSAIPAYWMEEEKASAILCCDSIPLRVHARNPAWPPVPPRGVHPYASFMIPNTYYTVFPKGCQFPKSIRCENRFRERASIQNWKKDRYYFLPPRSILSVWFVSPACDILLPLNLSTGKTLPEGQWRREVSPMR